MFLINNEHNTRLKYIYCLQSSLYNGTSLSIWVLKNQSYFVYNLSNCNKIFCMYTCTCTYVHTKWSNNQNFLEDAQLCYMPTYLSSLTSVRPLIRRDSATFKKAVSLSWSTLTSPLYMKSNNERISAYGTSLSITIGCLSGCPTNSACQEKQITFSFTFCYFYYTSLHSPNYSHLCTLSVTTVIILFVEAYSL